MTLSKVTSNEKFLHFLELYEQCGSLTEALELSDLSIHQIRRHQLENTNFDKKFRDIESFVNVNKRLLAREKLHDLMIQNINQGYINEITHTRSVTHSPDFPEPITKDTFKSVKRPLPSHYYDQFFDTSDILGAVATLAEAGLIPTSFAHKLLSIKDRLSSEAIAIISGESEEQDTSEILKKSITDALNDI